MLSWLTFLPFTEFLFAARDTKLLFLQIIIVLYCEIKLLSLFTFSNYLAAFLCTCCAPGNAHFVAEKTFIQILLAWYLQVLMYWYHSNTG